LPIWHCQPFLDVLQRIFLSVIPLFNLKFRKIEDLIIL
jgi:hypothetical protein